MTATSKNKLGIIFLTIILVSSVYISLLPAVQASEPSLQAKSLSVLNDVLGVKMDQYAVTNNVQRESVNLDALQKEVDFNLVSAGSSVRITCAYVKDNLKLVYLSDLKGNLSLKQTMANTVDAAKGVLSSYQQYAGDAVYGEFASMLNNVKTGENLTRVSGNVKLEVSNLQQNTANYLWTYIDSNGVIAERKNICLTYERGMFKAFYNNWPLYTIADTTSKLSAEQATALAIEASKNYSYKVIDNNGTEARVSGFSIAPHSLGDAQLIYVNSKEQAYARGGDPYRMYLAWYVPLGFDRFYPGDVSGLSVILWADTGEICRIDREIVDSNIALTMPDAAVSVDENKSLSTETSPTPMPMSNPILGISPAVAMVGFSLGVVEGVKSSTAKKRISRSWAILLCLLLVFSVLFVILPKASATSNGGKSRAYYTPGGSGYNNTGADTAERLASESVCNYIAALTTNHGYSGSQSAEWAWRDQVLSNITNDESSYDGSMVFYVGHQDGDNVIQDNNGNSASHITASDVMSHTTGKHFFVFIWVCGQAPAPGQSPGANSMAAAWLHRNGSAGYPLLDSDGFGETDSDPLGQCYISFNGYSPMVSNYANEHCGLQYNGTFYEYSTKSSNIGPCINFIESFYDYAFLGYSVHDALNQASNDYFVCPYSNCVLNTGYNCWWPGGDWNSSVPELSNPGYYPKDYSYDLTQGATANCMRVLGDSSIHLTAPPELVNLSITGRDASDNAVECYVWLDGYGVGYTDETLRIKPGTYTVMTGSQSHYLQSIWFNEQQLLGTDIFTINTDSALKLVWAPSSGPGGGHHFPAYMVFFTDGGGTTDPYLFLDLSMATEDFNLTAIPYPGYEFDYWSCNGEFFSYDNPVLLSPGSCTMYAHFKPVYVNLTVTATAGGSVAPASGTYTFQQTTPASLTAYPDSGNVVYWYLDDQLYRCSNSVTVTMDTNHTIEARFVNNSLAEDFGNSAVFEGLSLLGNAQGNSIQGQVFTCPHNCTAQSITAAVSCATAANVPVRYAIYSLHDCDLFDCRLIAQTEIGAVPSGGGWLTLYFEGVPPMLQENVPYLLAAIGAGDPYGVWIASGSGDCANVTSQQCSFDQDLIYPQTIDPPYEDSTQYSIYCTIDYTLERTEPFPVPEPHWYISSIDSYNNYVSDPNNLVGDANDQQYATLFGTSESSSIVGVMNENASGHIYLYGCSSSYLWWGGSTVTVYVSPDGENWVYVNQTSDVDTISAGWIDCGVYPLPFSYIRIDAQSAMGCQLNLDSVRVYAVSGVSADVGNTDLFYENPCDLSETLHGQMFICPTNCSVQSVTAAVGSWSNGYVRYAIYRADNWSLVAQTDYGECIGGWFAVPEWVTLDFAGSAPTLQGGVDYVLVVSALGEVNVASTLGESPTGIDQSYSFSTYWDNGQLLGYDFPATLQSASINYNQYSLYCTIMPTD